MKQALVGFLALLRSFVFRYNRMFDEFSSIQGLRAFESKIYDALYEYCEDREGYDDDAILAIDHMTLEVKVDNCSFMPVSFETYEIERLLFGGEPDVDAINELANKYIFS